MSIPTAAVRIDAVWANASVSGVNVWHGQTAVSGSPTVTDTQTLVDRLQTFYTAIADRISTGTTVTVGARAIAIGLTPEQFIAVTPRVVAGTAAGDPLPLQTTLTLKLRTVNATRRGRGRVYLSFMTESDSSNGAPTAVLLNDVNTAAAGLISSPSTTLPALGVLSNLGNGTVVAPDPYLTVINSAVAGTQWSVLRSRRR